VAASRFVGRADDLRLLEEHLAVVRRGAARLLSVRGRRQVGKSRLVTEFVERSGLPHLFTTATGQGNAEEDLERFRDDAMRTCTLPGRDLLTAGPLTNWEQALRAVDAALPDRGPAIVVFDEFPWLLAGAPGLEGTLQKLWDRVFENRSVLMILIGSDLAVMELLTQHNRPLFGRAKEVVVAPLHVADTARMLEHEAGSAAQAFDAQLVTGGYPRLLAECHHHRTVKRFIDSQLDNENSDLAVMAQRILDAEFPAELQAARVLRAIGAGDRTFAGLSQTTGLVSSTLARSLDLLEAKGVVAVDEPTSTSPSRQPRYRVADPYLRFWLRFVEPSLPDISRGRADVARQRVWESWPAYRGRAVEPLVRESLIRLAAVDPDLHGAGHVGGWWPRNNNPEIDLVGVDRRDSPRRVCFVGAIKWRDREPFGVRDLAALREAQAAVPGGADAPLVAVSRTGSRVDDIVCIDPDRLLGAWS
jgi:AAA+ ATPase superfamily predicted ATPase